MSKNNNTPRTQSEAVELKYGDNVLPFSVVSMTFCEGIEEEFVEANRKLEAATKILKSARILCHDLGVEIMIDSVLREMGA